MSEPFVVKEPGNVMAFVIVTPEGKVVVDDDITLAQAKKVLKDMALQICEPTKRAAETETCLYCERDHDIRIACPEYKKYMEASYLG